MTTHDELTSLVDAVLVDEVDQLRAYIVWTRRAGTTATQAVDRYDAWVNTTHIAPGQSHTF